MGDERGVRGWGQHLPYAPGENVDGQDAPLVAIEQGLAVRERLSRWDPALDLLAVGPVRQRQYRLAFPPFVPHGHARGLRRSRAGLVFTRSSAGGLLILRSIAAATHRQARQGEREQRGGEQTTVVGHNPT